MGFNPITEITPKGFKPLLVPPDSATIKAISGAESRQGRISHPARPAPAQMQFEQDFKQAIESGQPSAFAEQTAIEPDPWADPAIVAETVLGMGVAPAIKTGIKFGVKQGFKALGRTAARAGVAGTADIPIGMVTEKIGKDHPYLALPFNILLGMTSGVTLERAIENKIIHALTKRGTKPAQEAIDAISKQVKSAIDAGQPDEADRLIRNLATAEEIPFKTKADVGNIPTAEAPKRYVFEEPVRPPKGIDHPKIQPDEKINAITLDEAGKLIAKGDTEVIHSIQEGVQAKGSLAMQDAIRNEEMKVIQKAHKGPEREAVKAHIQEIEPEIDKALKGEVSVSKVEKIKIVKDVMKFTPSQRQTLQQAIKDISSGELVKNQGLKDPEGYFTGETLQGASMYPEYFKNKGYTSKEVLGVLRKALNGQPLTKKQQIIVEDINQGIREQWAGELKEQRATKEVTAWDLQEGDKLKRHGETYTVKAVDDTEFEPKVVIKNSETLTLKGNESIKYDRGTLKKGEAAPDFVKTDIKGEEQAIWRGKGFDAEFPAGKKITPEERAYKPKPKIEGQEDIFAPTPKETEKQQGLFVGERPEGAVSAGGLRYGEELPKYAKNINLERVDAGYDVKKLMLDTSDIYTEQIKTAKQGKITLEETRTRAEELLTLMGEKGKTSNDLIKSIKTRTDDLDAYMTAGRDILNTSAQRLEILRRDALISGSDEAMARFRLAMQTHAQLQAEVGGGSSKIGRALGAHRLMSQPVKNWKAILNTLGGREMTEDIIDRLSQIDPTDQAAVNKFIQQVAKIKFADKIFEVWVNAILSGPVTHVVNTTSNTLTFLSKLPEEFGASSIDLLRSKITRTPRERYFGELPEHVYGTWQGLKEGVRAGLQAYQTEIPSQGIDKLELRTRQAIKGTKGRIVRIPGRALMAEDEFFKAINYQSELHSLAYRQAAKEGLKGDELSKRIAEILDNPLEHLKEEATGEMLYRVFQKDLGPIGKQGMKLRDMIPGARYIIPFVRTPVNIAKFGLERTPLAYPLILKRMLKGDIKGGEISDELAKATLGSMVAATTLMYAKEGSITGGGPKDKDERAALYRTGWQPYSVKIGDKYVQYGRLEPLGMIIGLSADAAEIWDEMDQPERENLAPLISMTIARNLTNKTFLKGMSDAFNAWQDPERYGERWIQSFGGTVVPSGVAQTARAIDPEIRDAQSMLDTIKSRIPYVSRGLTPKRNIWGEPIERTISGIPAMVSLSAVSEEKGSKADTEMVRLKLNIGMPAKKFKYLNKDIEMTPQQYDEFMQSVGPKVKTIVDKFVEKPNYDKLPDEAKGEIIRQLYHRTILIERYKYWRNK